MRGIFILTLVICAIASTQSRHVNPPQTCCGQNEIWKKCGGCDGSCANPYPCCNKNAGPPGCYCLPGYVRDLFGNCIKACECPKCKCNEVWRCGNCEGTVKCPNKKCNCACRMGCYCKDGYVRNCKGDCVPIKDCNTKPPCGCGGHKKYEEEEEDEYEGDEGDEEGDED